MRTRAFAAASLAIFIFGISAWGLGPTEDLPNRILGSWKYDGFIFDDVRYPNPNPRLNLVFTFKTNGVHHLIWTRENTDEFCERRGTYSLLNDELTLETTWVNPRNHSSCAHDVDMQPNRTTTTKVLIEDDFLTFLMDLNGRPFHYLLRKIVPLSGGALETK